MRLHVGSWWKQLPSRSLCVNFLACSDFAEATRRRLEEAAARKEAEEREKAAQRYQRKEYRTGKLTGALCREGGKYFSPKACGEGDMQRRRSDGSWLRSRRTPVS